MKKLFISTCLLLAFLMISDELMAQSIRVRIFSKDNIDKATFTSSFGTYFFEDTIRLKKQDKLSMQASNGKIDVYLNDSLLCSRDSVRLSSKDLKCFFQITPLNVKSRRYDNDLLVKLGADKKLLLINIVNQDNYLAGVIQSEAGGASDEVEFFKVQAICCRTYMQRFQNKHIKEGYNLCDDVNCQVYFSRANKIQCIEGANATSKEVIVDSTGKVIEPLFHSNSGGQTARAKDVWGKDVDYLQSIQDTFSLSGKNATWEKVIKKSQWVNYFANKGVNVKDKNNKEEIFSFSQSQGRKATLLNIPLTQIRKDFNLKSTFFDVMIWGSDIKLKGRGYGHGVGMSQEGAAQMCQEGYQYWEVIEHYYQSVSIKNLDD